MSKRVKRAVVVAAALGVVLAAVAIWFHRSDVERVRDRLEAFERVANVIGAELIMELPRKLRESSGVAVSVRNPGLFWTHNDSGNDPILYGLRPSDSLVAEVRLAGAEARDWEDISTGPCIRDRSTPCIYIGDIGNNRRAPKSIGVFVLEEPRFDANGALPAEAAWDRLEMGYDGGPRNAEALAVSRAGDLVIVDRRGIVFRASRDDLLAGLDGAFVALRPDGVLPLAAEPPGRYLGLVTAATLQGDVLVARTYSGIFFYRREGTGWMSVRQPCWVGHLGPLGEGLDVAPPDLLYLTRERRLGFDRPAALHRVVCNP